MKRLANYTNKLLLSAISKRVKEHLLVLLIILIFWLLFLQANFPGIAFRSLLFFFFLHIFMYIWDFIVSLHFFLSFNFTNFLFQVRELFCFLFQIYYCTWFCLIPRSYFMTFSFNWSVPPVIFLTSEVYLLFYSYFFTQFFFSGWL